MSEKQPIGVLGAGWVGVVTAACFAELGHRVVARDVIPEKVEALRRGELPIHEPGLPELIELVLRGEIDPGKVFDLTLPLAQVAEGYRAMDERRAIKTLLQP